MAALRISQRFRLAVFLVVPFLTASAVPGQNYGLEEQVLTLGPAAFQPFNSDYAFGRGADGYLGGPGSFTAPLSLPNGAEILELCLYGNVQEFTFVEARIRTIRLVSSGQVPEVADIRESDVVVLGSDLFTGYVRACTAEFSYVLSDSTGSGEHISHEIFVAISVGPSLGGLRIAWRRQVSPPPGTPTFGDVPPSDAAFPFIEALVASGYHGRLRQRELLPGQPDHAPADGGLPGEGARPPLAELMTLRRRLPGRQDRGGLKIFAVQRMLGRAVRALPGSSP